MYFIVSSWWMFADKTNGVAKIDTSSKESARYRGRDVHAADRRGGRARARCRGGDDRGRLHRRPRRALAVSAARALPGALPGVRGGVRRGRVRARDGVEARRSGRGCPVARAWASSPMGMRSSASSAATVAPESTTTPSPCSSRWPVPTRRSRTGICRGSASHPRSRAAASAAGCSRTASVWWIRRGSPPISKPPIRARSASTSGMGSSRPRSRRPGACPPVTSMLRPSRAGA